MSDFSSKREFGLDLVRALAILGVVISHSLPLFVMAGRKPYMDMAGGYGVELFFVLSGFLIGSIFIRECDSGLSAGSLKRFWVRRWMRTLPAYYAALLFSYWWKGHVELSYLLFLQWPVNGIGFDIMQISWSLAIEEWFYILLPIVTLLVAPFARKHTIVWVAVLLIAVGFAYRVYALLHSVEIFETIRDARVNSLRFDGIAMGVLLAYANTRVGLRELMAGRQEQLRRVALAMLTVMGIYFFREKLGFAAPHWFEVLFQHTAVDISCVLFVVYWYCFPPQWSGWRARAVYYVSLTSYSNYLWHFYVMQYLYFHSHTRGFWMVALYYVLVALVATLMHWLTERPFLALRERMRFFGAKHELAPELAK